MRSSHESISPGSYLQNKTSLSPKQSSPKRGVEEPYVVSDARVINLGNASPKPMRRTPPSNSTSPNSLYRPSPTRLHVTSPKSIRKTSPKASSSQPSHDDRVSPGTTNVAVPTNTVKQNPTLPEPPSRSSSSKYAVKYYSAQGYGDNQNKVGSLIK